MSNFTPSNSQAAAVAKIKDWYLHRRKEQQVFRLFGYAGTGKSTVLDFALKELGLEPHRRANDESSCVPGVIVGTFTGKAALVLRRKGVQARTIHSMIYSVIESTDEEIATAVAAVQAEETKAMLLVGFEKTMADAAIEGAWQAIKKMKVPRFGLNDESDAADCKLIVLDEVSMVGPEQAVDLLSFGKPILVLGDPGQLPPIKGEGAFTQQEPDVMLTEIHRQAADSAILRLATWARTGAPIPMGRHDDHVYKMRKMDVTPQQCLQGGQVICGLNATRFQLNNAMRRAAGFNGGYLPSGPDEKLICLKNNGELGIVNGMFLSMSDVVDEGSLHFTATLTDEDGHSVGKTGQRHAIYKGHFEDHVSLDKERHDRDWKDKKKLIEATYGWAVTCHKAQGSQWENIIVWDDGMGRTEQDRRCWLYTAITRAERGLVILA